MGSRNLYLLLLLPVLSSVSAASVTPQKTKVSVYSESLSPKSSVFFTQQLYPTWLDFKQYITLDLDFYGRTTEVALGEDGYSFECIHGPAECVGNMMLMCAKVKIPTTEQFMIFANCSMAMFKGAEAAEECAAASSVDLAPINMCASTLKGQELLHLTGLKQMTFSPALDSSPWILINDVFTESQMMAARQNLRQVVCDANPSVPRSKCQ